MVLVAKQKRSPTIQHRKRTGQHHKQSRHYAKPYWPYLPLLAIVGIGIIINGTWSNHAHHVLGDTTDMSATQLLADTNTQRTADHEGNLQLNSRLTAAAQAKANDMVKRNYWSHNAPDGRTPWSFMMDAGYQFQIAGENLAYGFNSSNAVINGWMNSVEHRANILDQSYKDVGFGIASSPNYQGTGPQMVIVAMYGKPAAVTTTAAKELAGSSSAAASGPAAVISQPKAATVSRLQIMNANIPLSMFAISAICAIGLLWFVVRHGLRLRRALVYSEKFVIHHQLLDVAIIGVATLGFIFTRAAGFIH